MKKLRLALSIIGLVSMASFAHADDTTKPLNSYSVYGGVAASQTAKGATGTGYSIGVNSTIYENANVFIQPNLEYVQGGNFAKDSYYLANLDIGYTFPLSNGMAVSPKIGVGMYHAMYTGGSNDNPAFNAGLDFDVTKKVTVGLQYNHLQGTHGTWVDLTTLNVGYKF